MDHAPINQVEQGGPGLCQKGKRVMDKGQMRQQVLELRGDGQASSIPSFPCLTSTSVPLNLDIQEVVGGSTPKLTRITFPLPMGGAENK